MSKRSHNEQITLLVSMLQKEKIKDGDLLKIVVESDRAIRTIPKKGMDKSLVEKYQHDDIFWPRK